MTSVAAVPPPAEMLALGGAEAVPAAAWDRLARRGFHRHAWFAAAERCGWRAHHVVIGEPARPEAVVPAYLVGAGTPHDLHDRWLGPLRDLAPLAGLSLRPVLSVQAPFAQTSEPLAAPGALPAKVLHRAFELLEAEAERAGARAVAWPWVDAERDDLIGVARERGYAVLYSGASAWLPVRWGSFGEYVASRSRNVRRTVRAEMRAFTDAGLRATLLPDFGREAPAMDRLYRESFRRRNGRSAPTPSDLFERLARPAWAGQAAHLTWDGSRLVGTSLNVWTRDVLDGTLAGFAPEHRAEPAYYNDLCYEPIRLACARGIAAIDLGATALHAKVLRGAVLRRRMVLIRGGSPGSHRLLRAWGGVIAARVQAKERRSLGPLWGPRCFEEAAT